MWHTNPHVRMNQIHWRWGLFQYLDNDPMERSWGLSFHTNFTSKSHFQKNVQFYLFEGLIFLLACSVHFVCRRFGWLLWDCVEIVQSRRWPGCTEHASKKVRPLRRLEHYIPLTFWSRYFFGLSSSRKRRNRHTESWYDFYADFGALIFVCWADFWWAMRTTHLASTFDEFHLPRRARALKFMSLGKVPAMASVAQRQLCGEVCLQRYLGHEVPSSNMSSRRTSLWHAHHQKRTPSFLSLALCFVS